MNPTQNQATGLDLSPAEVLRGAAVYVARYGFHQGDLFASDLTPFPPACAQGAVKMAICGHAWATYTREQAVLFDRTMRALVAYLDTRFTLPTLNEDGDLAEPSAVVAGWNDQPGRTAHQLVTALLRAGDEWDFFHHRCPTRDRVSGGAA